MRWAPLALLFCGISCNAAIKYEFSYTALNGPVKSFSFSFTAPSFLSSGATPAIAPFNATDGTHSWTFTNGLVGLANPYVGCFMFGTPSAGLGASASLLVPSPCAAGVNGGAFQGGFAVYTQGGLPTATGTYPQLEFGGGLGDASGSAVLYNFSNGTGSMTLTISDTTAPQPLACSTAIACNILYQFAYTAINGPVKSFTFSFSSPRYLQAGDKPTINPFTPSDSIYSWTLTRGAADVASVGTPYAIGCFMFGTPFAGFAPFATFGPCGVAVGGPGYQAGFYVNVAGGLPTAPGTYTGLVFGGAFGSPAGMHEIGTITNAVDNTGTMSLTISETPALLLSGAMADLAAAGNWQTTFTLVNKDASESLVHLNLFAEDGNPLLLPLFESRTSFAASSAPQPDQVVESHALLIANSSGLSSQPVQVGSAQLLAKGNVGGFAIFKFDLTGQEAAVPLETRDAASYLLAFDNTNGVALGVALQNVSPAPASIPVVLRDDRGVQIGSDVITLAGLGHTSFVIGQRYPVTANARGTIEFDTPVGGRIGALGMRFTPPGTLTTIPVLANVSETGGSVSHLASGGGWKTTVVLVNAGTSPANATLTFFDDSGNPLPLPLAFVQTGQTSLASKVEQTIGAGASVVIESQGRDTVNTGSMQLSADGQVSGYAIFRYVPSGQEAVAAFASSGANSYVIPFEHTNGIVTGTAINNAWGVATNVPVVLRDEDGNEIGTGSIPLAGNGHAAFVLSSQFPVTANIRGTAEFTTPPGAEINVLGIRTTPAGTFTTLPPVTR